MAEDIHEVDFESLSVLDDGKLNLVLRKHLQRANLDCQDRPGDSKARKVTVEIAFVPVWDTQSDCTESSMQVKIKSSIPDHASKPYSMGMRRNGTFIFNNNSLVNVNQNTLDFDGDDE